MSTIRHMKASIEGLLNQTNVKLGRLTGMNGKAARQELQRRAALGHKYIPCGDCEGFDPMKGCPGHEEKNKSSSK